MAANFKTATSASIGTSLTTVYTCPSAKTVTILGLFVAAYLQYRRGNQFGI